MSDAVALALDRAQRRPGDGSPAAWDGGVAFVYAPKVAYPSPH